MTDRIDVEHAARWAELDSLLPGLVEAGRLDPTESGLQGEDRLLTVDLGGTTARGLARFHQLDPDGQEALWGPLRQYSLTPQLAGPDRIAAFRELLDRWLASLRSTPGDWESSATVTIPSRDPDYRIPLLEFGFAPMMALAARRLRASTPPGRPGVLVRPAQSADLDLLTDLAVRLQEFDVASGMVTSRPSARRTLNSKLADHLARQPGWSWIAEVDGLPAGFVYVQPPSEAAWISPMSAAGGAAAYLAEMYVRPEVRAAGIGAALVATAHRALDTSGVPLTLLHHAVPNPLSSPFWARMGYRPLWTSWQRRPAAGPPR
jgi:GNAT superfamily N-acetyltransferase